MKVLQVHTRYREPGGEEVVADREATVLRDAGHQVDRYELHNPADPIRSAASLAAAPWNPRQARLLSAYLKQNRPDVAHVHNTWFAMSPSVFKTLSDAGIPTVFTLHNFRIMCANASLLRDGAPCELCVGASPTPGLRYRCYRGSTIASAAAVATIAVNKSTWARHVDVFTSPAEFNRETFAKAGLPEDRLVLKPNFAPDPGARPQPPSRSERVLFVGRPSLEKGLDLVLEAWPIDGPLRLTVVGDGPRLDTLRRRHPHADYRGALPIDELQRLMLEARALVVPSRWYEGGVPLVMVDALASGLPVMATDHGAIGEVGRAMGPGWTSDPTVAAWRQAIDVLDDDDAVDRASELARSRYEKMHAIDDALDQMMAVYERALERRNLKI